MESQPAEKSQSDKTLQSLEKQLENSGFFTHTVFSQFAERINENEGFLYGLIDYLIEKNGLSPEVLKQYVTNVKNEIQQKGEVLHTGVALRLDKEQKEDSFTPVNCAERLPVCKAACCKLNFALSPDEVESGKVKWELGHPYFIRHENNGCCSHLDSGKQCCSIYDDRPKVCRQYSCANDKRIWKDFDNMILNEEWMAQNLAAKEPRIFSIKMNSAQ